ncbi:PIN domain-containing protein [Bradyrhizobium septentrionale]|uniref:PIN domain-containing protein n=1 Tax=Bradyrhizobium septentrionale TaxID=1404411 RepID=UPI001F2E6B96|nr:PIN domain-containing protein [Bradyrhizobium septentrionale]UGY27324.1 PIN domain-containing protein [Bradyrhizobium septentrionale]
MDDRAKALFVDTNGFLQVRDLKDIPWIELFPDATAVDLMVAPSVIDELDKHKNGTNQRRRDRARLALSVIDKASLEPGLALVIRAVPIRIRIVISKAQRFNWSNNLNLDPANPDDQLVGAALSFGNVAAIFSHDTGPRIRARIAGLKAYEPNEEWLLPAEQTDDQRTITRLQSDLKRALSPHPSIAAGFKNYNETTSEVQAYWPILVPLESELVERLVADYMAEHPRADVREPQGTLFSAPSMYGISSYQIAEYHTNYSNFEGKVRDYFQNLHEYVASAGIVVAVDYWVRNDSNVAAQGLRIEMSLDGEGSLVADREDAAQYIGTIKAPEPPNDRAHFKIC